MKSKAIPNFQRVAGCVAAIACAVLVLPTGASAQSVSRLQTKPVARKVYSPLVPAGQKPPAGDIPEELLDREHLLLQARSPADTGIPRTSGSSESMSPVLTSVTLWSGAMNVTVFESGGNPYAAVAFNPGLRIYSLSGGGEPSIAASDIYIDVGAWSTVVEGTRLYLLDYMGTTIFVYDISNPAAPTFLSSVSPSTISLIWEIAVENSVVYMAGGTNGLGIIDLNNLGSPVEYTPYTNIGTGSVRDVAVAGGYAFIPLLATGEVQVVDVSDPSAPFYFDGNAFAGQTYEMVAYLPAGGFHSTDVVAAMGEVTASGDVAVDFYSWVAGSGFSYLDFITLSATDIDIRDITLFESQAYAATGPTGTWAIDITDITGSVSPTLSGQPGWLHGVNGDVTGVAVDPSTRSLLQTERYGGVARTNLLDDASPLTEIGRTGEGGRVYRSYRWDEDLLFVANERMGITVMDISDPYAPFVHNNYEMTGWVYDLELDPPYVYVAEGNNGVTVLYYDDSANSFTQIGNNPVSSGYAWDVEMNTSGSGAYEYLYAAQGVDGVIVLDISDPYSISQVGNHPFSGAGTAGSYKLQWIEGWEKLAVAQATDGVDVLDMTTPSTPSYEFTIAPTVQSSLGLAADFDDNLWVSDNGTDLSAYDISTGSATLLGSYNSSPGDYRQISSFELNAFLGSGWDDVRILNYDDPTAVFEETWLTTAGFARHIAPGMDHFYVSDNFSLVGAQLPSDLLIGVLPADEQWIVVGDYIQFSASGWSGNLYWDTDPHPVDGRAIAAVDATGYLSAIAAGATRVYVYDDASKWGVSGVIYVMGGPTLVDNWEDTDVYNIDDTDTNMFIPEGTFDEPVEVEIATLDIGTQVPAPPSGWEHFVAYDLTGTLYWPSTPLTPGDFNWGVYFQIHYNPASLPVGTDESSLRMWRYDSGTMNWTQVTATTEPDNDIVYADLTGFSTYSVMYPTSTLAAPGLISPTGGIWVNKRADIELKWNAVTGATSYNVEVATDPGFAPADVYATGSSSSTSYYLTISAGDGPEGSWYWRVQSDDGTFLSPFSSPGAFVLDVTGPQVYVSTLPTVDIGHDVTITADVTDNFQVAEVRLWYRSTGSSAVQEPLMTNTGGDTYEGIIAGSAVGYNGFQYLVKAKDGAQNLTAATTEGIPNPGQYGGISLDFPSLPATNNFPADQWMMVSVPHVPDNRRIGDLLTGVGPYDDTVWRFFRWRSGQYMEESSAQLETGRAYWLHHRTTGVHFEVGSGSTVFSGQPFQLVLESGWNDIGSPWLFDVAWSEVEAASGFTPAQLAGPYKYQSGDWVLPGVDNDDVRAYRGVSVYNYTGGNLTIYIPPIRSSGITSAAGAGRGSTQPELLDGWRLQLMLSQEGAAGSDNQNYVGVMNGAAAEWDENDYPDPPLSLDATARLAVDRSGRSAYPGHFATDYIDQIGDGYSWPIVVESIDGTQRAVLSVQGVDALPDGYSTVLVDSERNMRIDIDDRTPYRFFPSDAPGVSPGQLVSRPLNLLVGTPAWLNGMTAGMERLPASVELHPNYPNPFNPSTTIRFALREAARVRLEIRNVRGQLVKVLADGMYNAGEHTLVWNGTDESGRHVATGIYLYRLEAGGAVRSRKMTLIR